MMNPSSAKKLLSVLERVTKDSAGHRFSVIVVVSDSQGVRFESDTGASLAFLPNTQVSWHDALAVFTNMAEDATNSGCPGCVEIEEQRVTLNVAENTAYIRKATR